MFSSGLSLRNNIKEVQGGLEAEVSTRVQAISSVQSSLNSEVITRENEISKVGFISTAEAEGVLLDGSYPFCFGMGNPSEINYGLPLPFSYTLHSIAYTSTAKTADHSITFNILHNPFDTSQPITALKNDIVVSGASGVVSIKAIAPSAGNLVVEIVSTSNLTDDDGKYRISFILTSNDSL